MTKKPLLNKLVLALATLFGVGYMPLCPGSASCLVAVLIYLLIPSPTIFFIVTVFSTISAFLVCGRAEKLYGQKDCKYIVIDDFSGMLISFLCLPHAVKPLFVAAVFFLFRMLDMLKIPPANIIEQYKGSKGIVGDDVVAGLYSLVVIQTARAILAIVS